MTQFARPAVDITRTEILGGAFDSLNETSPVDTDFVYGRENAAVIYEAGLSNVSAPSARTGHFLRYRIAKLNGTALDGGGVAVYATGALYQGSTLILADSQKTASGAWVTYELPLLTAAEAITDYSDLRFRLVSPASGGSASTRRAIGLSWVELVTPDGAVIVSLTAEAILTGTPELEAPALGQLHSLLASSVLTGTPVLGMPSISQIHDLSASSILTGSPVLGTPSLSEASNEDSLTANDLLAGSPVLGTPSLGQRHNLTASSVLTGSPVLGTPSLSEAPEAPGIDSLTANDLLAGTPVLEGVTISQIHNLTADPITTGSPVLNILDSLDTRIYSISGDSRLYIVSAEDRCFKIEAESRSFTLPLESRILGVMDG